MVDSDITDLLTTTFTRLQLLAIPRQEPLSRFDLFPELPTEIRLKIFSHALPIPAVLDINAKIIVSDPAFGLYIAFSIPTIHPVKSNAGRNLTSINERRTPKQTRVMSLLSTCRESRDAYLLEYGIALPYDQGIQGSFRRGTLYISRRELLHWDKLDDIIRGPEFQRALQCNYRLQDFWSRIESLALPITCFVLSEHERMQCRKVLQAMFVKMENLKTVEGVMWKGFLELQDGAGKCMLENSMRRYMSDVETTLRDHQLETNGYRAPSFGIIF